jgi:hypothetical protein
VSRAGSGAFNLLAVVALCIVAVPEGQVKRVRGFAVFVWTAVVSLLSFLWLLVVYEWWTPNVRVPALASCPFVHVYISMTLKHVCAQLMLQRHWVSKA